MFDKIGKASKTSSSSPFVLFMLLLLPALKKMHPFFPVVNVLPGPKLVDVAQILILNSNQVHSLRPFKTYCWLKE